ncbi:MAG TPA: hypothetical protein VK046_13525 [Actinomycetaceae bacterium]|nr:hypothetical protein [Actinomycetaceae bacterium]
MRRSTNGAAAVHAVAPTSAHTGRPPQARPHQPAAPQKAQP